MIASKSTSAAPAFAGSSPKRVAMDASLIRSIRWRQRRPEVLAAATRPMDRRTPGAWRAMREMCGGEAGPPPDAQAVLAERPFVDPRPRVDYGRTIKQRTVAATSLIRGAAGAPVSSQDQRLFGETTMALANILVHLDSRPRTAARLALSLRIAERMRGAADGDVCGKGRGPRGRHGRDLAERALRRRPGQGAGGVRGGDRAAQGPRLLHRRQSRQRPRDHSPG